MSLTINKYFDASQNIYSRILQDFINKPLNFGIAFEILQITEPQEITSLIDLKNKRTQVLKLCKLLCLELDPEYFIPGIINSISLFYGNKMGQDNRLGVAIKLSLSFIWKNTYDSIKPFSQEYNKFFIIINLLILYITYENLIRIWEIDDEIDNIQIHTDGISGNKIFHARIVETILLGSHEYKILKHALNYIWTNPKVFLEQLNLIIRGEADDSVKYFANTFLSKISIKEIEFWSSLWSKIVLIPIVMSNRQYNDNNNNENPFSIGIFSMTALYQHTNLDANIIQNEVYKNFWQQLWHFEQYKKDYFPLQHMIIDRPVIRINKETSIFGSSLLLLQDSINNQLEQYIHRQSSSPLYEEYFSRDFENEIVELFRANKFKAGEVMTTSNWKTQSGNITLSSSKLIPGQIDLLALSEFYKTIIIGDCKLLKFPYEKNTFRNLLEKIGDNDGDGFHKKLSAKRNWLKSLSNPDFSDFIIIQLLITNRSFPKAIDSKWTILSTDQIKECISNDVSPIKWKDYWKNKIYKI